METKIIQINNTDADIRLLTESITKLAINEPFIFPTETVYGIGCRISDLESVNKIYELKDRDYSKPMAVHIGKLSQLYDICESVPAIAKKLFDIYYPGPVSIVLNKKKEIPDIITAGKSTVGVRFPDDYVFRLIADILGEPLVATSANISGRHSPVNGSDVISDFNGKVSLIIDSGLTGYQKDSTVVSLVDSIPMILREGAISANEILSVLNKT